MCGCVCLMDCASGKVQQISRLQYTQTQRYSYSQQSLWEQQLTRSRLQRILVPVASPCTSLLLINMLTYLTMIPTNLMSGSHLCGGGGKGGGVGGREGRKGEGGGGGWETRLVPLLHISLASHIPPTQSREWDSQSPPERGPGYRSGAAPPEGGTDASACSLPAGE